MVTKKSKPSRSKKVMIVANKEPRIGKQSKSRTKTTRKQHALSPPPQIIAGAPEKIVAAALDATADNLRKIDHIVVLMMENRSFDHMLGYRKLNGKIVDGLDPTMKNTYQGTDYSVHHLDHTAFLDGQDPCHSGACVATQRSNTNGGFVANWVQTYPAEPDKGLVMGYYDANDVAVFEMLANQYCICDKWFSSVPGATWPNRLYSICGKCDGSKDNTSVPWYDLPSFVQHLDRRGVSWNWYSHDFVSLRVIDSHYRLDPGTIFNPRYRDVERSLGRTFLKDARDGRLPSVSWIDPNFNDFLGGGNDDHPPVDIRLGQELVLKIVHAVQNSPNWDKTLLIVVYDEHGGLFDHVPSPAVADDDLNFRELGLRVPAFVISPWVDADTVSSMQFDHTSLIKTILMRYCDDGSGNIPDMGARVNAANHLGSLLSRSTPRPAADLTGAVQSIAEWKAEHFTAHFAIKPTSRGIASHHNELQVGIAKAKQKLAALEAQQGKFRNAN